MKKILIFSGAGVSKESGIETFRDSEDGLWENYDVMDVATPSGWKKDRSKVLEFYNIRRRQLKEVHPNLAHDLISKLERDYEVTVVTQNVDDLHERAGSTNVIHLHGELNKVRSTMNSNIIYEIDGDVNVGDKCEFGSQLRPHIVWFNESLDSNKTSSAIQSAKDCDICIIIGTSMSVSPANEIPFHIKEGTPLYCIDPNELEFGVPSYMKHVFKHIKELATIGMEILYNDLTIKKN
jgi:NAD-dependent deacetylase